MIQRWAHLLVNRAKFVLAFSVLVVIGAGVYGAGVFASLSDGGFEDPGSESAQALALERDRFGNKSVDVIAIYSSDDLAATAPAFRREVRDILADLPKGAITSATTYYDTKSPDLLSQDGRSTQVHISLAGGTQDEMGDHYDAIKDDLESTGRITELETQLAGPWAVYGDVNENASKDLAQAEKFSLPIVLILSLIIFGSLVAASMPVLVGAVAVVGALAVVRLLTLFTEVSVFSINVITLLGMGLAIDYALFVVSRFREELAKLPGDDPAAVGSAVRTTMATAGRTVLFSGLTVAAAMASLLIFPQGFLRSMGYGGIAAVVVAMLAALTILPALLMLLGRRIDAGRLPWRRHRPVATESDHGPWAALAHSVMRRPVAYLAVIVVAMLALASPFLGVKWGSVDYRVLPAEAPAHIAAETLNSEFGRETSMANIMLTGADRAGSSTYIRSIEAVPGVIGVQSVDQQGDSTLLRVSWTGNSQSAYSQELVGDLRGVAPPIGSEALVGGLTADTVDLLTSVGDRLPWMGLTVVGVMLLLLFLAFGSVVLPIKAVVMNAVSITASFGVVTWIFSDGNLEGLLGFESTGFLDATQPILMLAILFGLSLDYEVFLLSRVREQWDLTGDNTLAVATGVQKTGRIITSAALLLAVVIGAFATSGLVFMKLIGIGMLVALLIDATVVRALLVPATMKLLGRTNWWAPGPMRRWWERYGVRETTTAATSPDPAQDKQLVRR